MKYLFPIFLFLISCNVAPPPDDNDCDTVFITKHDTIFRIRVDTFYKVRHDTLYKIRIDTFYKVKHDTIYRTKTDTVIKWKHDTVRIVKHDTIKVAGATKYIHDTITITKRIHDTIIIKCDTVIIPPGNTQWGILQAQDNTTETRAVLNTSKVDMVRVVVYFNNVTKSVVADDYLKAGYKVQLNFNWKSTGSAVGFPTDANDIRAKAEAFFQYYLKYRSLIPVVVVENEWDNLTSIHGSGAYHSGTVQQYLNELAIITEVGHKYGFKIADAGITGNNLQRWTYSRLTGSQQTWWKANYFIGQSADYDLMVSTINEYAAGVRAIPIDYVNMHWYNRDNCPGGYPIAVAEYLKACGKTRCINNEWGIKTKDLDLFKSTVEEIIKSGAEIGIIYSGMEPVLQDGAIKVTAEMLQQLK